jgi:hypothetical protein
VARRLQTGAASYLPASRALIGRLPLLGLGAALLGVPLTNVSPAANEREYDRRAASMTSS